MNKWNAFISWSHITLERFPATLKPFETLMVYCRTLQGGFFQKPCRLRLSAEPKKGLLLRTARKHFESYTKKLFTCTVLKIQWWCPLNICKQYVDFAELTKAKSLPLSHTSYNGIQTMTQFMAWCKQGDIEPETVFITGGDCMHD